MPFVATRYADGVKGPALLLRLSGELGVKSRGTRQRFVRRLTRHLRDALRAAGIEHRIHNEWSRLLVETEDPAALEVVSRVFGVHSVSPIRRLEWSDLDELLEAAAAVAGPSVEGRTFAVRARRGRGRQRMSFRSPDVERRFGALLRPHAAGVDLGEPEVEVEIEVHEGVADLLVERFAGPGGFPPGVQGRALALVSGGFDSIVAAWTVLRRGVGLDYLHCALGDEAQREAVARPLAKLFHDWTPGDRAARLHVVDFRAVAEEIRRDVPPPLHQVVLKRAMLRAAAARARDRVTALVTGDAIGQVSSQTLGNLATVDRAIEGLVLRPLLGFDKDEICARARRIGTWELSARIPESCDLAGEAPSVRARLGEVERAEEALSPETLHRALEGTVVVPVRDLAPETGPDLAVDAPGPGAGILDVRPEARRSRAPLEGAVAFDPENDPAPLARDRSWVVVCDLGWRSAITAERLRRAGLRAAVLRGGVRTLRGLQARARGIDASDEALLRSLEAPAVRDP